MGLTLMRAKPIGYQGLVVYVDELNIRYRRDTFFKIIPRQIVPTAKSRGFATRLSLTQTHFVGLVDCFSGLAPLFVISAIEGVKGLCPVSRRNLNRKQQVLH